MRAGFQAIVFHTAARSVLLCLAACKCAGRLTCDCAAS